MLSKILYVQMILHFYSLFNYLLYICKEENANQTKYSALDIAICFVSHLDTLGHYEKLHWTCHDITFMVKMNSK